MTNTCPKTIYSRFHFFFSILVAVALGEMDHSGASSHAIAAPVMASCLPISHQCPAQSVAHKFLMLFVEIIKSSDDKFYSLGDKSDLHF